MPCRSAAPLVDTRCPAPSRPPITVGPVQPGVGCAATPRGLSTTTMSSSSYTMPMPGTGSAVTGAAGARRRRQRHRQLRAGHDPVGLDRRPAVDEHVAGRDQLGRAGPGEAEHPGEGRVEPLAVQALGDVDEPLARAHGSVGPRRLPRLVVRGGRGRVPVLADTAGAVQVVAAQGEDDRQDAAADDRRVGQVEDRVVPGDHADPVDDVAAEQPRCPEDPVAQVPHRAAEQQAERDRPAEGVQPARGPRDVDDDAEGDHGEDDRLAGADAERRARVAGQPQRQHVADAGGPAGRGAGARRRWPW